MADAALPQFNSREEVAKALHDMHARMQELEQSKRTAEAKVDEMSRDLVAANRALAELSARPYVASGKDAELTRYIDPGTKGLIFRGGVDKETKEWVPGLLDDTAPVSPWQHQLQALTDARNMVKGILGRQAPTPIMDARIRKHMARAPEVLRKAPGFDQFERAFVDSSTVGADWIIDLGLPEVAKDNRLVSQVEALFRVKSMNAQTELLPYMTTGLRPYKKAANTSGDDPAQFTSSSLATASRTIASSGMVVRAQVDRDASEDAIIAALPFIQDEAVMALRHGMEDCILNGDTTATHGDTIASWNIRSRWGASGLGGSIDHRRTFMGLRQSALDISGASGDQSSAETFAGMCAWRAALANSMGVMDDLVYIISPEWYLLKLLTMTEFKTADVVGGAAANVTGIVARVGGVRVVVSEFIGPDMNNSGVYDNSTKTKTGGLVVSTARRWVTQRQGQVVEIDTDITRDIHNLVVKNRKGFFDVDNNAVKNVYYAYKLSAS